MSSFRRRRFRNRSLQGGPILAFLFAVVLGASAGAPVVFRGEVLYALQTGLGPFSAGERAAAVARRLETLVSARAASPGNVAVRERGDSSDIALGSTIIDIVTEADAEAAGQPRAALAAQRAERIRAAVVKARSEHRLYNALTAALLTALATGVLMLSLLGLARLFPRLYTRLESWRGTRIRSIRIQRLELISGDRLTSGLVRTACTVRVLLTLLACYFYISLVFSFFPGTRGLASLLLAYLAAPVAMVWQGFVAYVPNLFFIGVTLTITYFAVRFAYFIFREVEKRNLRWPGFYPEWAMPTFKIVRFMLLAFAAMVIFPYLPGSDSPGFKGISIFLGVLFSLGSTSAVANLVAGVILTYTRAFGIGDRVQIADTVGDVAEKTLLATRVITIKNVSVTIPNGLVLGSHVINYSAMARKHKLILNTVVTLGYGTPWRRVHELLISAASATPYVLADPPPFVLQTGFNDFYVQYEINAYTADANRMHLTYAELRQNIQDKFSEAGVQMMSPHYLGLLQAGAKSAGASGDAA